MKLVIDRFVHEPPGISIIPETDYEAAVLNRYWESGANLSIGRASSEHHSTDGRCYSIKFVEAAPQGGKMKRTPLPPRSASLVRSPVKRKRTKERRGPFRCRAYLDWISAECRCMACAYMNCWADVRSERLAHSPFRVGGRKIDPAHGPVNGGSSKGPDDGAIPLCRHHHDQQHALGWPAFEAKYGFSREKEAAAHFAAFQLLHEGNINE